MEPEIEIVEVEAADAAVLRGRVAARDLPGGFMPLFAQIQQRVQKGDLPADARHVWIVRHREEGQADLEVGVEVPAPFAERDGLAATRTPAGRAAHAVHIGDFSKLMAVHAAVATFCRDRGLPFAGVQWEVYSELKQPPEKRRCDVYYLLA